MPIDPTDLARAPEAPKRSHRPPRTRIRLALLLIGLWPLPVGAQPEDRQNLRERLTEREDEYRVEDPWTTDLFGFPLSVSGQYEFGIDSVRRLGLGDPELDYDGLLLEQELEIEAFYTLGTPLSLFAQVRLGMAEDLLSQVPDQISDQFVERGEMWLYSEDIAGSGFALEVGRLDFEDDRRWWWDEELDAVRVSYETDSAELQLAVARELGPIRSDRSYVDPEQQRVLRYMVELSWDWADEHAIELFALHHDDHSVSDPIGSVVSADREDDSDAQLTWAGLRATGARAFERLGVFAYWFDSAVVTGRETLLEFDEPSHRIGIVEDKIFRDVFGWALDIGTTWMLPLRGDPRLTFGYAVGSGDRHPEGGDDDSFRQTDLQSDEPGFGGVRNFASYGTLLDPELSNLHIWTFGAGVSLAEQTTLDVVYHYYRLFEPATSLRDSLLDPELDGRKRDLGHGIDLVLAIEDFHPIEIEIVGSFFRAGHAFSVDRGKWAFGGAGLISIAF